MCIVMIYWTTYGDSCFFLLWHIFLTHFTLLLKKQFLGPYPVPLRECWPLFLVIAFQSLNNIIFSSEVNFHVHRVHSDQNLWSMLFLSPNVVFSIQPGINFMISLQMIFYPAWDQVSLFNTLHIRFLPHQSWVFLLPSNHFSQILSFADINADLFWDLILHDLYLHKAETKKIYYYYIVCHSINITSFMNVYGVHLYASIQNWYNIANEYLNNILMKGNSVHIYWIIPNKRTCRNKCAPTPPPVWS